MVLPIAHVMVYGMAWWASYGIWYGMAGITWSIVWPGMERHSIKCFKVLPWAIGFVLLFVLLWLYLIRCYLISIGWVFCLFSCHWVIAFVLLFPDFFVSVFQVCMLQKSTGDDGQIEDKTCRTMYQYRQQVMKFTWCSPPQPQPPEVFWCHRHEKQGWYCVCLAWFDVVWFGVSCLFEMKWSEIYNQKFWKNGL